MIAYHSQSIRNKEFISGATNSKTNLFIWLQVNDTQSRTNCLLSYQNYGPDRYLSDKDMQAAFRSIHNLTVSQCSLFYKEINHHHYHGLF